MSKKLIQSSTAEFLIFTTQNKEDSIEVRYKDENIWLNQKMMSILFNVEINTILEVTNCDLQSFGCYGI